MQCGVCTHSFAGSRLVSCQVPETVCCRSRELPACSPGIFLRGTLPRRYTLSSSSLYNGSLYNGRQSNCRITPQHTLHSKEEHKLFYAEQCHDRQWLRCVTLVSRQVDATARL